MTSYCFVAIAKTANTAKFIERDSFWKLEKLTHDVNSYKRSFKNSKQIGKRTLTPTTIDTPETIPQTPDMNVDTPDTPDTPDTKTIIPDTYETPVGSGLEILGDVGSADSETSGYSEIEDGNIKPILYLSSLSDTRKNTTKGTFKVLWKPTSPTANISLKGSNFETEATANDEIKVKENEHRILEGFRKNRTVSSNKSRKVINETTSPLTIDTNKSIVSFTRHNKASNKTSVSSANDKNQDPFNKTSALSTNRIKAFNKTSASLIHHSRIFKKTLDSHTMLHNFDFIYRNSYIPGNGEMQGMYLLIHTFIYLFTDFTFFV